MPAMLVELTTEVNEESFVIVLQRGHNDVTCKQCIAYNTKTVLKMVICA